MHHTAPSSQEAQLQAATLRGFLFSGRLGGASAARQGGGMDPRPPVERKPNTTPPPLPSIALPSPASAGHAPPPPTDQASYQGGELVYAGIADLLWGGRAVQPEELLGVIVCVLHSGCADGVLDGKEDGRPQKEGWLPHSLSGQGRDAGSPGLVMPRTPPALMATPARPDRKSKLIRGLNQSIQ